MGGRLTADGEQINLDILEYVELVDGGGELSSGQLDTQLTQWERWTLRELREEQQGEEEKGEKEKHCTGCQLTNQLWFCFGLRENRAGRAHFCADI